MNPNINYLLGICLAFSILFSNCGRQQTVEGEAVALSDLPSVYVPIEPDSIIEIRNWLAIGPFEFYPLLTDPVRTFYRNDLKKYGIKEGVIDETSVENLQKRGVGVFLIDALSPQIRLFRYLSGKTNNKSNFYLVARIHSAQTCEAMLVVDGSYSYALWLNGDKQIEMNNKYNVNKAGDRFVRVTLKEGENIVFAKVNRGTNKRSWDLICAITTPQEGERTFRVNCANDFVVNPIVDNALEIYAGPYLSGKVEVLDDHNQIVASSSFENQNTNETPFVVSGLNKLETGFYKAVLTVGSDKIEQMIYKGDYTEFVKNVKTTVSRINNGTLYADDLKAAMDRVDYLNNKPKEDPVSPDETRFVNRNRVFWGYSLSRMFQQNALTQLMTYRNKDSSPDGVFIFHHSGREQQQIPLVMIVPPALDGNSMIEDWYTSNLDQIETDNALADRYGFAVAWLYAGGKHYSSVGTEKEITAVIDRLQSEYDIDSRNVFIMGDCEGGRRALVQLALSPDRYAACFAASPLALSGGADGIPINLLPQMGTIPIFIRHQRDDDTSPVENSRRFYAEAQKLNMQVEYMELAGSHINVAKDWHSCVFEFFNRYLTSQPFSKIEGIGE